MREGPGSTCDVILIGGSAGSIPVIQQILGNLPADLGAAVLVVVHQAETVPGSLAKLFDRGGPMRAETARDEAPLLAGCVYVAPAGRHLLVEAGRVRVTNGPRENGFRPAVDALFRTAAAACGARTIGIIVSGYLDDGTIGLLHVRRAGGVTIAQEPQDAAVPDMPAAAIRYARPDHVVRGDEIAPLVVRTVRERAAAGAATAQGGIAKVSGDVPSTGPTANRQSDTAVAGDHALTAGGMPGMSSGLTCPACGGSVWQIDEGDLVRFQCHVGHRYSAATLAAGLENQIEAALWAALRALQERSSLNRRMAERAVQSQAPTLAQRHLMHAHEAESRAETIRRVLLAGGDEAELGPAGAAPS